MDQAFLNKMYDLLGPEEVHRIREAAKKTSHDHAPENIDKCQCRVCQLKRKGIDYFRYMAAQRGDWIKKELEREDDGRKRGGIALRRMGD